MEITTVKISGDGYLVNDKYNVPTVPGNRYYQAVQEWIEAGNTPDPEFTQAELDEQTAAATFDSEIETDREAAKLDAGIQALINARPAAIENYINNNVTDLATAKDVLIILAKMVSVLARREIQ